MNKKVLVRACALASVLGLVAVVFAAAPGLGELRLDGAALQAVVAGNLPGPMQVTIPAMGQAELRLIAPRTLRLVRGGIEGRFGVRVDAFGLEGSVDLRYEPKVLREQGIIRLEAVRAQAEGMLSMLPDLASLLPPVDLPRVLEWPAPTPEAPRVRMRLYLQEVRIADEAMVIRFSLLARPLEGR
ncbi:MAG TPA: hypothetical protein ENK10_05615 [Acidobacteria bacterium]|nr:hypothetical protein [Acidobacteriota bacterium]